VVSFTPSYITLHFKTSFFYVAYSLTHVKLKVKLVAVNSVTYTIDLADFYTVPAPYAMPSGFISIADNGADPSGQKDSTGE